MSVKPVIGDKDVLNKKIPSTNKYLDVGAKLNTGGNVLKVQEKPDRRGELFKRMKTSSLHTLLTDENPEMKVLLLDVRPQENFELCSIRGAESHPYTLLSRAVNPFTQSVYSYKNKEGHLVVIYDYNEEIAVKTGNVMFEKGLDNVVVLTGGLRKYCEDGYQYNVNGTPPPPPKTPSVTTRRTSGSAMSMRSGVSASNASREKPWR
eukprot:TRINITY_DN85305_c0_g1_i1.p1 TRINITY_DN85305_c0_g1~~TRINITY_DN85305_c0_g1_i1.p1  ORF type:complete len:216 (+),score=17.34 TRINITY_DN85305_c0_g1_i1:31-648(+)